VIDWLFRDRHTGRITIGQFPNIPLWIFLAATALQWLFDPTGNLHTAIRLMATVGLLWWALDEILRGVNPWRRFLGAAVLASGIAGRLS
jgi:hypothetical protein